MRNGALLKLITTAVVVFSILPTLRAQGEDQGVWGDLPDFSATEVRGNVAWKIYHSGQKLRVEASPAVATIWAPQEDKVFNLMIFPEKTTCVAMKSSQALMMKSLVQLAYGRDTTRTLTAVKESVDGHTCTVTKGVGRGSNGQAVNFKIWASDDLKRAPLRIEFYSDEGSLVATYRDVVVASPNPALFELPANCIPYEKIYQIAPENSQGPPKPPAKP